MGPPVWGLVWDPLAVYSSTIVYIYLQFLASKKKYVPNSEVEFFSLSPIPVARVNQICCLVWNRQLRVYLQIKTRPVPVSTCRVMQVKFEGLKLSSVENYIGIWYWDGLPWYLWTEAHVLPKKDKQINKFPVSIFHLKYWKILDFPNFSRFFSL